MSVSERAGYERTLPRFAARLPILLVYAAALIPLIVFLVNPFGLLVGHHAFRQTQTALTSYWLQHGGGLLSYVTPVLGYPWSVPLEFPLFQGLVAAVSSLCGLPLDFTGRLVSLTFFYATCIPIIMMLRRYGTTAVAVAVTLFLTSPILLFFCRTFLIETLATFLAVLALWAYISYLRHGRPLFLVAFAVAGSLAGLQKITTFAPVFVVCGLDFVVHRFTSLTRGPERLRAWGALAALASAAIIPAVWIAYTDHIKETGLISSFMTSEAQRAWNFGSLSLRLTGEYWIKVFGLRILGLGGFSIVALLVLMAALKRRVSLNREAWLFLGSGLAGPLIFANLHFLHDYYQVASLVFFACAIGVAIAPYTESTVARSSARFAAVISVLVAANLVVFGFRFWFPLMEPYAADATAYRIASYLRNNQAPQDVTLIVGMDYESTLPYYSERYALMIPSSFLSPEWPRARDEVLKNPEAYTGGRKIGPVVYCEVQGVDNGVTREQASRLLSAINGRVERIDACVVKVRSG